LKSPSVALLALLLIACEPASEERSPTPESAPRVVTLAPHLAELVFAVGAGDRLVGVSAYTDYPEAAAALPVVGDAFGIDQERLAALSPDVILAWDSGTPTATVDSLRAQGHRVEVISTRGLDDIESALRAIGRLVAGSESDRIADDYRATLDEFRKTYADRSRMSVFYQVSERPLYTVNGEHYISELLGICGGDNVFADLRVLAPSVDVEAVVARDPAVLVTSGNVSRLSAWDRFDDMQAVVNDARVALPSDEAGRPGPRVTVALRAACDALDDIRSRRQ